MVTKKARLHHIATTGIALMVIAVFVSNTRKASAAITCETYFECTGWDGDYCYDGYYYETCTDDGEADQNPDPPGGGVGPCGLEIDAIRNQYLEHGVGWRPECSDFTNYVPSSSHYSFDQWKSQSGENWAVLREYLVANTYCIVLNAGVTPPFSSGYRTPSHNRAQEGRYQ